MMKCCYSLNPAFKKWRKDYENLEQLLLSMNTLFSEQCVEREIFTEGLFLRFVTSWESFFEEYFLRCMCTAKTIKGKNIKPLTSYRYYDIEQAFAALTDKPKKTRENYYLNWLSTEFLKNRITFFRKNSRMQNYLPNYFRTINHINIVRNQIVHRSKKAIKDFQDLIGNNYRYLSSTINSSSNFLLGIHEVTNESIFRYYMTELDTLAEKLSM